MGLSTKIDAGTCNNLLSSLSTIWRISTPNLTIMKCVLLISLSLGLAAAISLGGGAGGVSDAVVDKAEEPVQFAVQAINDMYAEEGDTDTRVLVEIVKAQTQIVSGLKQYLTLHMTGGAEDEYCYVEVVFKPWVDEDTDLVKRLEVVAGPNCGTEDPTVPLAGGESPVTEITPRVLAALAYAVMQYNNRSNNIYIAKVGATPQELDITGQVVAGYIYRFSSVPLVETECQKSDDVGSVMDLAQCEEKDGGLQDTCDFEVYVSFGSPPMSLTDMTCQ